MHESHGCSRGDWRPNKALPSALEEVGNRAPGRPVEQAFAAGAQEGASPIRGQTLRSPRQRRLNMTIHRRIIAGILVGAAFCFAGVLGQQWLVLTGVTLLIAVTTWEIMRDMGH